MYTLIGWLMRRVVVSHRRNYLGIITNNHTLKIRGVNEFVKVVADIFRLRTGIMFKQAVFFCTYDKRRCFCRHFWMFTFINNMWSLRLRTLMWSINIKNTVNQLHICWKNILKFWGVLALVIIQHAIIFRIYFYLKIQNNI